ncbi:MAG: GNAT family N-acetyltransferase [Acholeplasmatales bacterium]|nr:GNAT family N-acetyltransferase [Acholeplasmatales bacterium]
MMYKITKNEEVEMILAYINGEYKETPYLYINIKKYGVSNINVRTWVDFNDNNEITGVYMIYYDCLHFFTRNPKKYPLDRLLNFINSNDLKVIMLQGEIGSAIEKKLLNYNSEKNYIFDMDKICIENNQVKCSIAMREDILEISDLLMNDSEYYNVYERQILIKQLLDRFDSGFSRFFVVRINNKIVASCSTYGETDNLAIVGGLIVHPKYRNNGLASAVESYACDILKKDNISRIVFVNYNNYVSLKLQTKLGGIKYSSISKFVKK